MAPNQQITNTKRTAKCSCFDFIQKHISISSIQTSFGKIYTLRPSHPGAEPGPVLGVRPSLFIPCKPTLTFRHKEGALGIILVNVLLIHYLARAGGRGISHNGKGKICFLNLLSSHFHSMHFEKTLF